MNDYEINELTLAVLPLGKNTSLVYEDDDVYNVDKSTLDIVKDSCLTYGSTLDGRIKGTERLIGVKYKPPVVIDEVKEIIFFPTCSCRYKIPIWVGLKNLKSYYKNDSFVVLEFRNNVKIRINESYGTINNQILRASRLESVLRGRKTF